MILRGDFVHAGGLFDKSGCSGLRFHANIPLYKTHRGCGSFKYFVRRSGQGSAAYYADFLENHASSTNPENTQSDIDFIEFLKHVSLVYSPSDLEAVRVIEADEYDDFEDILHGAHPSICAGDIVQPVKDEKGVKSYLPFTLVVSCTSSDDKVCTLFFSCWSLYYILACLLWFTFS